MAAATASILTDEIHGDSIGFPVAAATTIYAGTLGALNTDGNLVSASDAANLRVIGRAEQEVDNSAGSAGDLTAVVKRGVFMFANSSTAAVDADDKGKFCYVEDNQTVAETSTHKCKAGIVLGLTADGTGVFVDTRYAHLATSVPTALAALTSTNGTAAAASASLANLAAEAEKIGDDVRAVHATVTDIITALQAAGILK